MLTDTQLNSIVDSLEPQGCAQTASPTAVTQSTNPFYLYVTPMSSHPIRATVTVAPELTTQVYLQAIELFRSGSFEGFDPKNLPAEYIEETYKSAILTKVKNYILHYLVIDYLSAQLLAKKITLANYPRLSNAALLHDKSLVYNFEISTADVIELKEWKLFAFKSPRRKKYKDLDKQVISFVEANATSSKKVQHNLVEENDWVLFDAQMIDKHENPVSDHLLTSFWFKVSKQEVVEHFVDDLLDKTLDSRFHSHNLNVSDDKPFFECKDFRFQIFIRAIVKGSHFSVDLFKDTFKLKNKVEIHNKLMEVFSYRNDISQRKAIIEEVFHLLLSKHRFEVPQHLILRRQEDILSLLVHQPDYHVYKAQKDFQDSISLLAEKQLKEEIIIDQIAYQENISLEVKDTQHYLHLLSNKRLKEFIFFKPILAKIDELEGPISSSLLAQAVMREKTLNHVIHMLTR